jgi:hypothetical protein
MKLATYMYLMVFAHQYSINVKSKQMRLAAREGKQFQMKFLCFDNEISVDVSQIQTLIYAAIIKDNPWP